MKLLIKNFTLLTFNLLLFTFDISAQWSGDPMVNNPISTASGHQNTPTIVSDGLGGAIITWHDGRNGNTDIYAQRIDASGVVRWVADGVVISSASGVQTRPIIVSDSAGGAIIAWEDSRNGNPDIYAQKIDSSGIVQWTANGVAISTASNLQSWPTIASDGSGGAIISWQDDYHNPHIYAQRISAIGVVQWTANGVAISTAANSYYPVIVGDNSGGGIITWSDYRNGNPDIYAQRIDSSGGLGWQANGVPICTASLTQSDQIILSDGSGGAIITWSDLRGSWMQQKDVYAQRIHASGVVEWQANGVPISTLAGTDQRAFGIASDGSGGAIISWLDSRSGIGYPDIYMQKIDGSGTVQWAANGVRIYISANQNSAYHGIVSDGSGGAIITWHDDYNYTHIYAQRINASGVVQWTAIGILISTVSVNQQFNHPKIVSDGSEGAIITWGDSRNGNQDIYAQRVRNDGSLGGDFSITRPQAGEKWIAGETDTIRWTGGQPGQYFIIEYSIDDGATYTQIDTGVPADSNYYVWTIPNGIITTKAKIKITDVISPEDSTLSGTFKIKGFELTTLFPNGNYDPYNNLFDRWSFGNDPNVLWNPNYYNQFNYQGVDPFTNSEYPQYFGGSVFREAKSSDFPDWPSFVNTFGINTCYRDISVGTYSPTALAFWESIKGVWQGSCFGMAVSNFLYFSHKNEFINKYPDLPDQPAAGFLNPTNYLISIINELWVHQLGIPHRESSVIAYSKTPNETLNELRDMLLEENYEHKTLSFWNNNVGGGGHAVSPYKVERDIVNPDRYFVYIYDNSNFLNQNSRFIIDITGNNGNGSWTNIEWPTWGGNNSIGLMDPVTNYLSNPTLPKTQEQKKNFFATGGNYIDIWNTIDASIIIKDQTGNQIGYSDSILIQQIPDAFPVVPSTGSETPPYGYTVPEGNYSIQLKDFSDTTSRVSFFTENSIFSFKRYDATTSQSDKIYFDDGLSFSNPDIFTKSISMTNILNEGVQEKMFSISSLSMQQTDSLKIYNQNSDELNIANFGSSKDYEIEIEIVSNNMSGTFINSSIILPQNSSHILMPDWNELSNSTLMILLDEGNNGTIDDTLEVENQYGTTTTFQLAVTINNGWNMVSVPGLHPTNQNVNTWWSGKDPAAGVFRYSGGYQSVTDASPGTGYWMKHLGVNTYNTGEEWPVGGIQIVAHNPLIGQAGWNLIGGYEETVATAGLTTNPPGLITGPIYKYSGGYQVAPDLVPGYGYWIKLNSAGEINIPGALSKGNNSAKEYFEDKWGKIIITDAAGMNYTLYAITGNVDLDQYELPPAPPEGMFDIRFSSGRIAEDINSSVQSILFSGIEHPFTLRAENIDIKLQDESGIQINAILKSGEEIVINDVNINKLMVSGELVPAKYELEQNYPNPFNPTTTIKYSIAKQGNVSLKVYDMLGSEVATLVNEEKPVGVYEINFNASNLASGIYFYKIQAGSFVETKKMIFLK